jgi:hypothetical protein
MGDRGDGSCGNGRAESTLGERSKAEATAYNASHGRERFRVVAVIDGERFPCERAHDRITPALERVGEIERTAGVKAFVIRETSEGLR